MIENHITLEGMTTENKGSICMSHHIYLAGKYQQLKIQNRIRANMNYLILIKYTIHPLEGANRKWFVEPANPGSLYVLVIQAAISHNQCYLISKVSFEWPAGN